MYFYVPIYFFKVFFNFASVAKAAFCKSKAHSSTPKGGKMSLLFSLCKKAHIRDRLCPNRIRTRGVNDNILKYARTHDATYTSNILLRIRTVFPNSNRIPWNTLKHSKRHTPTPFLKKTNIDQLQTMMISSHWNILV